MNIAVLEFVSDPQNGFVPHGFIAENTVLLKLLQAHLDATDEEALMIFLDMEKAFDKVSFDYIREALPALGFTKGFTDFTNLIYSHTAPPTRQLFANGYLSPSFELHSGVPQGCPLSPLIFLAVSESLTRTVQSDTRIKGIKVGDHTFKLSQYADDTVILASPTDVPFFEEHLDRWQLGTDMKENQSKREALPCGALKKIPNDQLPTGVVKNNAYCKYGDHIMSLGIPLGNGLDTKAYFWKRYATVKDIMARWRIAHLSPAARVTLVQAFIYGRIRYEAHSMIIPPQIVKALESDVKHLVWASKPELDTDRKGTIKKVRPVMTAGAARRPQKKGGIGMPDLVAHLQAFQAQWGRRYLDPTTKPWKLAIDHYIADDHQEGRGILLSAANPKDIIAKLPKGALFLKKAFKAFTSLTLLPDEDPSVPTPASAAAEPIWLNLRFPPPDLSKSAIMYHWRRILQTYRITDLIGDDNLPYTDEE